MTENDTENGSTEAGSSVAGEQETGSSVAGEQGSTIQSNDTAQTEGNALKESVTPWDAIEQAITTAAMTYQQAAEHFNIPENTIRKRASRKHWTIGPRTVRRLVQKQVQKQIEQGAKAITAAEIEKHKRTVFDVTTESIAKFKAKAPKSFKELDSADKVARRAAGIEDDKTQVGVLLQLNESINAHDPSADAPEPIEGEFTRLEPAAPAPNE